MFGFSLFSNLSDVWLECIPPFWIFWNNYAWHIYELTVNHLRFYWSCANRHFPFGVVQYDCELDQLNFRGGFLFPPRLGSLRQWSKDNAVGQLNLISKWSWGWWLINLKTCQKIFDVSNIWKTSFLKTFLGSRKGKYGNFKFESTSVEIVKNRPFVFFSVNICLFWWQANIDRLFLSWHIFIWIKDR